MSRSIFTMSVRPASTALCSGVVDSGSFCGRAGEGVGCRIDHDDASGGRAAKRRQKQQPGASLWQLTADIAEAHGLHTPAPLLALACALPLKHWEGPESAARRRRLLWASLLAFSLRARRNQLAGAQVPADKWSKKHARRAACLFSLQVLPHGLVGIGRC